MDERFSRIYRLTAKAEYAAVFNARQKISHGWFLAQYKNNDKTYPRLGIIVSKRVINKAPARNYLKRIIREGFRRRKESLKGLDLVIMLRQGCQMNKKKLLKELDSLWERLSHYSSCASSGGCIDIS